MDGRRIYDDARATARPSPGVALVTAVLLAVAACGAQRDDVIVPVAGLPQEYEQPDPPPPDFTRSSESAIDTPRTTVEPNPTTTTSTTTTSTTTTSSPPTTTRPTTTSSTTTSTTVPPASTAVAPASTTVAPDTLPLPALPASAIADPSLAASNTAFDRLAVGNEAASMTVVRGGEMVFSRGSGQTIDGAAVTSASPMVVASVSKIIVALAIARLHETGLLDVAAPMPWADVGLTPDPAWGDVTVRELLDHRSGLRKARSSWFTGDGTCRDHIPSLLVTPPESNRGRWLYSNGNYCLLGLLVEQRTDLPLDEALRQLVFDPVATQGAHLTDTGLQPGDAPAPDGVERLLRLGGAGTLLVSTDSTATALGRLTDADRAILQPPGVFTDRYGWGHTGTVDGARACIWVLEDGATVVSATIAGSSVASGGGLCDVVVPAIATDLGIGAG